jgi:hypothetical protein
MRFFITDLRRALTERTFFASIIIAFASLLGAFIYLGVTERDNSFMMSQSLIFPFIAPFLAALPFGGMIITERTTKYRDLLRLRLHGRKYTAARFFTVGISGGLALLLPEALLFAVTLIMGKSEYSSDIGRVILLAFVFGFAFAVLSFSLTFYNKEVILPLMIPEVFYLLLTYAFPYLDLEKYYPPLCISPFIYGLPDYRNIGLTLGIITLFAIFLIIVGSIKEAIDGD